MGEIEVPSGFYRFGMACTASQFTVRLRAVTAVGEIDSINDCMASFVIWIAPLSFAITLQYDSRSGAEHDHRELMAALQYDHEGRP